MRDDQDVSIYESADKELSGLARGMIGEQKAEQASN